MAIDAINPTKRFLDYEGLGQFWKIINGKFADQSEVIKYGSLGVSTTGKDKANALDLTFTNIGNADGTISSDSIALPGATREHAGLMSADHFAMVDDLKQNINELAPYHGAMINGDEIALKGKRSNIKLEFETTGSTADGTRQAFISLVDANWTYGTDSWTDSTKAAYDAWFADPNKVEGKYTAYVPEGEVAPKYYVWSGDYAGPVNNMGKPLMKQAVSKIDVTELVKAGLLESAQVVINPTGQVAGTYLELKFLTYKGEENVQEVSTVYINVSDLIDVYSAGDGISISDAVNNDDDAPRTATISLKTAADDEVGGIKTNFTVDNAKQLYAIKVTEAGNAYVAVPWKHVNVDIATTGKNPGQKPYLVVDKSVTTTTDANGIPTDTWSLTVEAGEGLKAAEALAGTSVQDVKIGSVTEDGADGTVKKTSADAYLELGVTGKVNGESDWGKDITIELTDSAKASLKLADEAVQSVTVGNVTRETPAGSSATGTADLNITEITPNPGKGQKGYNITLGDRTVNSLQLADSALQSVKVLNETISLTNPAITVANAAKDLALGSAAGVNITDDVNLAEANHKSDVTSRNSVLADVVTEKPTVPTTAAVKTYVDAKNTAQSDELRGYVDEAIADLDSEVSTGNTSTTDVCYGDMYGANAVAQQVMIGVTQVDGKLTAAAPYKLGIKDIADFRPITNDEIYALCFNTTAALELKDAPKA